MTLRRSLASSACCLWLLQAFVVPPAAAATTNADAPGERRIWMAVGERRFAVTLADNEAARAFVSQLPLTLDMPDLNGNEKHQKLPKALPTSVTRPGTIRNGDLMLWGADTLVVFYLTFDSPSCGVVAATCLLMAGLRPRDLNASGLVVVGRSSTQVGRPTVCSHSAARLGDYRNVPSQAILLRRAHIHLVGAITFSNVALGDHRRLDDRRGGISMI
ncbi:MAG: hypothetical protein IPN24_07860 [Betaproteobacteria bacterium]|nr:hypothetical protein [Betaproteobacteria bacterium]